MAAWFPRPERDRDVVLLEPSGVWTREELFASLHDVTAEEWRHKVGVAGARDGSARPSTRLLASRGWVFKTREDVGYPSLDEAKAAATRARSTGRNASIWHPSKLWAVVRLDDVFRVMTACPELRTLRTLEGLRARMAAWTSMLQQSIDVYRLHGIGLDVNPSNFGREGPDGPLFYLDEDVYAALDARNVGGAIAARIPEEGVVSEAAWREWGRSLRAALSLGAFSWPEIAEQVRAYPLPERFDEVRSAIVDELTRPLRAAPRGPERITCVLADVHGNLPALEAVLRDARERGATDFLFVGDAVGYGPNPSECVTLLADLPGLVAVRGNHDHAIGTGQLELGMNTLARTCAEWTRGALGADALSWLRALPAEHREGDWLAVHGAPKDPNRFLAYVYELTYEDNLKHMKREKLRVCFYGHTHVQLTHVELASGPSKLPGERRFELTPRNVWLVNPGSVGQPRDGDPRAAYALWHRKTGEVETLRVSYEIARTVAAARAAGLPDAVAVRLQTGS